jgi:hypothetical protein
MMDELVAFVLAGVAADQAHADAMTHFQLPGDEYLWCPAALSEPLGDLPFGEEHCDCHLAERKARALREATAKRNVVRRCAAVMNEMDVHPNGLVSPRALLARQTLIDLAAVYADRPGYQTGWSFG